MRSVGSKPHRQDRCWPSSLNMERFGKLARKKDLGLLLARFYFPIRFTKVDNKLWPSVWHNLVHLVALGLFEGPKAVNEILQGLWRIDLIVFEHKRRVSDLGITCRVCELAATAASGSLADRPQFLLIAL